MKRPTLFAAGASALLLLASLPVLSSAETPEPFEQQQDVGHLELATSDTGVTVTRFDADGVQVGDEVVPVGQRERCEVSGLGSLLSIAPMSTANGPAPSLGLVSNGLGTRDKNNCSTDNGRVEVGQSLLLELGSRFDGTAVQIGGARLDIEGKFGADLRVRGLVGVDGVYSAVFPLGESSDNGPDAGSADNIPVDVLDGDGDPVAVDALELSPTVGTISLEGGGDFDVPAANVTRIDLVVADTFEYSLGCGGTVTEDEEALGQDTETGVFGATLTRYDNETDCNPIGVDLSEEDGLLLRKTTTDAAGVEQDPALRLRLTWRVSLEDATGAPLPVSDVQDELGREIDLLDGTGINDVQYCSENNDVDDGGESVALSPDYDPMSLGTAHRAKSPNDVPWCLLTEYQVVVDGYLVQVQVYDGAGDPKFF